MGMPGCHAEVPLEVGHSVSAGREISDRRPSPGLHAFQKKSKTGRETPRRDVELIQQRLREAERIAKDRER